MSSTARERISEVASATTESDPITSALFPIRYSASRHHLNELAPGTASFFVVPVPTGTPRLTTCMDSPGAWISIEAINDLVRSCDLGD
jgi:hypothetical protein